MNVPALVRESRRRSGISQRSLARRARTSQTHIARIEVGEVSPTVATLDRLLEVMGQRLELRAVPMAAGNQSEAERSEELALSASERVMQAAQLSYAMTAIAAAPKR